MKKILGNLLVVVALFAIELKTDKDNYFQHEPFVATLTFEGKSGLIAKPTPSQKGFEATLIATNNKTFTYRIKPTQSGVLRLEFDIALYETNQNELQQATKDLMALKIRNTDKLITTQKVTKTLSIKPQPLPCVGSYTLNYSFDKSEAIINEPVFLQIEIAGAEASCLKMTGFEVEGVKSIHNVFDEGRKIQIAYVANKSFATPAMALEYFDPTLGAPKRFEIAAQTIQITDNTALKSTLVAPKEESFSIDWRLVIVFVIGAIFGKMLRLPRWNKTPKIPKPKSDKERLNALLGDIENNKEAINELETKLYKGKK